jgi:non-homologous end joining protein Ku
MKIYNKSGIEITDTKEKAKLEQEFQTLINNRSETDNTKAEKRPNEHNAVNPAFERFKKSIEAEKKPKGETPDQPQTINKEDINTIKTKKVPFRFDDINY